MKNDDLFGLRDGLAAVGELAGKDRRFPYAVAKNARFVKAEIEDLLRTIEPTKDFQAYNKDRIELCKKHAEKDEKNQPKKDENDTFVIADMAAFDLLVEAMEKEKHPGAVKAREAQGEAYSDLLDDEVDEGFELYTIPFSMVPKGITPGQLEGIFDIIQELSTKDLDALFAEAEDEG